MSPISLLAAKLFPPPHRPNRVPRARLTQKFLDGLRNGRTVTVISAPAGFGKTTLVVEWLQELRDTPEEGRGFAWLSLEPPDNDRVMFLRYLLAALHTIQPGLGGAISALLEHGSLPAGEAILLPLLNELHELRQPFFLVLDDYHAIQDPELHALTAALLEHAPATMHTIIITRQDPLLPLARWRARGLLTEFRLAELRFNAVESSAFLQNTMHLPLTEEQVRALETRTEGWIAGLQMAAISLQQMENGGQGEAARFIQSFTGDDRLIMEYLIDEVISSQPKAVQEFLLHTAILRQFHAPLCGAVLEQPAADSAALLAYLEHANLFLIPLDHRSQWFRYHHLFAELLRYRLLSLYDSSDIAGLYRRAALWCSENDLPEQALDYAQSSGDLDMCARLVRQHTPGLLSQGEFASLVRWMRLLPDSVIRQDPFLCRDFAGALTHTGQLNIALTYLELAEQGFANDPPNLGRTLTQTAHNALMRGDFSAQIAMAQRSLALLAPQDIGLRGLASFYLGLGLLHSGEPERAEAAFRQALALGQEAENPRAVINSLGQLGRIAILRLDFLEAEMFFQRATGYQLENKSFPGSDMAFFDLAMLQTLQNRLDLAAGSIQAGMDANRRSGSAEMLAYGWRLSAWLHQVAGQTEQAAVLCERAVRLAASFDLSPLTLSLNAALQVEIALDSGDLLAAERAAPRVTNSLGVYPFNFYPEMSRVKLLLRQGRLLEAEQMLQPALEPASRPGWEFPRLQVRLLQALHAGSADPTAALSLLEEALLLARPAGPLRLFVEHGQPMRRLLSACAPRLASPLLRDFAAALLALFPPAAVLDATPARPAAPLSFWIEPLSEREIEVLRLIAEGLSNTEIANRLVLSPNTLKAHTQNIYAKLDVHSRVQAVNRARELGLIENGAN